MITDLFESFPSLCLYILLITSLFIVAIASLYFVEVIPMIPSFIRTFCRYCETEGSVLSKELFVDTVHEIYEKYHYHGKVHCTNTEEMNRAIIVDNSRVLYFSRTRIVLFGSVYRLHLPTYIRYISFLHSLPDGKTMTVYEFMHRFELYIEL